MSAFSAHKIAGLLDISVRRLQQLAAEGIVPRTDRGDCPLVECVRKYVRYLRATHGEMADGDIATHKARLIKFKADIAELEAGRLAGDLVPVAQVGQVWCDAALRVRSRLLGIPFKTGPLLAVEDTPRPAARLSFGLLRRNEKSQPHCRSGFQAHQG